MIVVETAVVIASVDSRVMRTSSNDSGLSYQMIGIKINRTVNGLRRWRARHLGEQFGGDWIEWQNE